MVARRDGMFARKIVSLRILGVWAILIACTAYLPFLAGSQTASGWWLATTALTLAGFGLSVVALRLLIVLETQHVPMAVGSGLARIPACGYWPWSGISFREIPLKDIEELRIVAWGHNGEKGAESLAEVVMALNNTKAIRTFARPVSSVVSFVDQIRDVQSNAKVILATPYRTIADDVGWEPIRGVLMAAGSDFYFSSGPTFDLFMVVVLFLIVPTAGLSRLVLGVPSILSASFALAMAVLGLAIGGVFLVGYLSSRRRGEILRSMLGVQAI